MKLNKCLITAALLSAVTGAQADIANGQWLQVQLSDWQPGTIGDPGSMLNWNYYVGITDHNNATDNNTDMIDSTGAAVSGVTLASTGWTGVGVDFDWNNAHSEGETTAPGHVIGAWESPNHWVGTDGTVETITIAGLDDGLRYNVRLFAHGGSDTGMSIDLNGTSIGPVSVFDRETNQATDYDWSSVATTGGELQFSFNTPAGAPSIATAIVIEAIPEPATFGLMAAFGGAMLFVRKYRMY